MPPAADLGDPDIERLARRLRLAAAVVALVVAALVVLPHLHTVR